MYTRGIRYDRKKGKEISNTDDWYCNTWILLLLTHTIYCQFRL